MTSFHMYLVVKPNRANLPMGMVVHSAGDAPDWLMPCDCRRLRAADYPEFFDSLRARLPAEHPAFFEDLIIMPDQTGAWPER